MKILKASKHLIHGMVDEGKDSAWLFTLVYAMDGGGRLQSMKFWYRRRKKEVFLSPKVIQIYLGSEGWKR